MLTATQIAAAFDDELDSLFEFPESSEVEEDFEESPGESGEELSEDHSQGGAEPEASQEGSQVPEEFSEPEITANRQATINIELSDEFELQAGPLSPQGFRLKVPIAVLGSWQHPQYGDVEFTEEDFADMIRNFSEDVAGFEPPLFYGHPLETEAPGGAPAVGFLAALYQEGDTLFGEFEAKAEAYSQVKEEYYRYSSAEVVRNAKSKETGEPIGTLLVGCALTNRPFLTKMPRVKALAEVFSCWPETATHFLFPLSQTGDSTHNMTDQTKTQNQSPEPAALASEQGSQAEPQVPQNQATQSLSDSGSEGQSFSAFTEQFLAFAQQLEQQRQETQRALQEADRANRELAAQKLAQKINRLEQLNLSQSVKDSFRPMLEAGMPAEQEEQIFASLEEMSQQFSQIVTTQQGNQEDSTSDQNAEDSNQREASPIDNEYYSQLIARNHEQAKIRQQRQAQLY